MQNALLIITRRNNMAYNINDLMKKDGKVERNLKPEEPKPVKEEPKQNKSKSLTSFFTDSEKLATDKISEKLFKSIKKELEPKEGIDMTIENVKKVFALIMSLLLQTALYGAIILLIIKLLLWIFSL